MDDLTLLATQVGALLTEKKLLLATAESCTGGGVAHAVTEISGSSIWFECGFITYSNSSKSELLNIPPALIAQHGSVSEEIAAAMAEGALSNCEAHVSIATTGIAGPHGAVPGKPVGTICFAWSSGGKTYTERKLFSGDRQSVRQQTVIHALRGLIQFLS
ncbi:CinA family protein [Sapientia aquatica]|uniref:CinA family protein n=1 Tax=Sapientia aquatica TaxID=1549640 RepID=A0A4R5VYP2_9BURK|nr:CinA family protein [Sapientia aquatica]TDK63602.1 CinA family protein [Sapientia aquatica]